VSAAAATPVQASPSPAPEPARNPDAVLAEKPSQPESEEARWRHVMRLPCQLTVDLTLPGYKVGDLLKLQVGTVITTEWHVTRDVPLLLNGTLIGWSEFEVVGKQLAVRLTELA